MIVRVALALALLAFPSMAAAETAGSGVVIEVKPGQLVTMDGQSPSLARLVVDLCTRSGIALRGYEAGDRPIMVSYHDVPLREVLQRMLRDETYMIGVRAGAQPADLEVSWVHVTGSKSGTPPVGPIAVSPPSLPIPPGYSPAKVPGSMASFGVAPRVITQALVSEDAIERRAATQELAEYLDANPAELDTFLKTDMGPTADELAPYPFANETLRALAGRQRNPITRAKMDAIVKAVDVRRNDPPKKPGYIELMQQGMPH